MAQENQQTRPAMVDAQALATAIVGAQAEALERGRPAAFDSTKICPEPNLRTCDRVLVKFFSTSGDDGNSDVVLNLNGQVIRVKRNVEVPLPKMYLESVANLAVVQQMDAKTQQMTPVMRYPYAIIGDAPSGISDAS